MNSFYGNRRFKSGKSRIVEAADVAKVTLDTSHCPDVAT